MKITIIGAGAIGTALGKVLKTKKENKVVFWDILPEKIKKPTTIDQAVSGADFVFFCLPSFALREAVTLAKDFFKKEAVVVCISKGIEAESGLTVDVLLAKILPLRQPFAVVFGPMLAVELMAGKRGYGLCAGRGTAAIKIVDLFSGTKFAVRLGRDLRGVALCGVLKNIYSVGLGMLSAVSNGENVRGAYISAACREMVGIIKELGGQAETALDLCGLGDLVATGYSSTSRNWQVGRAIARTGKPLGGSEGMFASVAICKGLGKKCPRYPVLEALDAVIEGRAKVSRVIEAI